MVLPVQSTSEAKSARRERSPRASVTWPPCSQPTIVVTHHAPSVLSVLPEFMDDPLTPSFVASFEKDIVKYQPRLWVHGHLHNRSDYYIRNTRVICNPRGHPSEKSSSGYRFR